MLTLNLKACEKIVLKTPAGKVVLTVLEIRDHNVRLGFEAPREVPVHREEVWQQIQAEKPLAEVIQEVHREGNRRVSPPAAAPAPSTTSGTSDPTGRPTQSRETFPP